MARIGEFHEVKSETNRLHGLVECGYRIFTVDGQGVLQLETYGSQERKDQGTISQSIQIDQDAAETMYGLLLKAFPHLGRR